ncbi:hypothetical protein L210DRAFT_3522680 [Boletus edulis BED1]|uniref:Uncharacterized protein n=1 Tax=Boletus edulis BED1 TaxID=1328754 RepID=A0AAD4GLM9_BOLED|nr:hypothetical protein L210DRAFT_3522680 [Boletus edulis BED1]
MSTCALVLFRTSCSVHWCRDMSVVLHVTLCIQLVGFCKLYVFLWVLVQQEL